MVGGEEGDAGAARGIDPEAGAQAVGVAGMAAHPPPAAEQIVAAAFAGDGQELHREAVGAVEAAVRLAVAAADR